MRTVTAREALESRRRELIVALMKIDAQIAALKGRKRAEPPVVVDVSDVFGVD